MNVRNLIVPVCGVLNLFTLLMPWRLASDSSIYTLTTREYSDVGYMFLTVSKPIDQLPVVLYAIASVALIALPFMSLNRVRVVCLICGVLCLASVAFFRIAVAQVNPNEILGGHKVHVSTGYGWYLAAVLSALSIAGGVLLNPGKRKE